MTRGKQGGLGLAITIGLAAWLVDHFVGALEDGAWDVDAERLGRPEVDDPIEFGRLLDREVGGRAGEVAAFPESANFKAQG